MGKTNNPPAQALPSTWLPTEPGDAAPLPWQEPQQAPQICRAQECVLRASEARVCKSAASRSPPPHHIQDSVVEKEEQGTETEASNISCNH